MDTLKEKLFYASIDKIIWETWDPIDINTESNARNEYFGYIPMIFEKALKCDDDEELAKFLFMIETQRMELDGNYEKCKLVSKAILSLKNKIDT